MSQMAELKPGSGQHNHHSGARSRRALSLRTRLALLVAVVVMSVVGIEAYLQTRVLELSLQRQILETARLTAQAVAEDIRGQSEQLTAAELTRILFDFAESSPALQSISVVDIANGVARLSASTRSDARPETLAAAQQAAAERQDVWLDAGSFRRLAVPVFSGEHVFAAVVVTVSLYPVEQARAQGRRTTLWFAVIATLVMTGMVDLLTRRLVHRPIAAIHETMRQAGTGDLSARVQIARRDEIGRIGTGLNEMLDHMQQLHGILQDRVNDATAELRQRNAELVENYQRILSLREALARAEQMVAVGQMAANTAHQIGTPLNLISGYVQMMMGDAKADARSLQRLRTIEEQIAKVTGAVQSMLAVARTPSLARQPADAVDLVRRVCELSRPSLTAAGVGLELECGDDVPPILADAVRLELALLNLITNSLDAMPGGGTLRIAVTRSEENVRIEVADTGTGIPPELLPRIFDLWVTTKPLGRGTGLGLSITREAVTSHGGSILVKSDSGQGAAFTIELPALPTGVAEPAAT